MKETRGNEKSPTVVAVNSSVFIDFFYDTLFKQKQLKTLDTVDSNFKLKQIQFFSQSFYKQMQDCHLQWKLLGNLHVQLAPNQMPDTLVNIQLEWGQKNPQDRAEILATMD